MTEIPLPKPYCAAICKNALTDLCLEHCALERKGRWFELRKELSIQDMPRFPINEFVNDMTADERKIILGSYTAKLVDQAQGYQNEYIPVRRPNIHTSPSSRVSSAIPIQDILHASETSVTVFEAGKEHSDIGIPAEAMDQSAD